MITLTENGKQKAEKFINECKAKRKEIIEAGKDTANETNIPDISDIISDIELSEEDKEYCNGWSVTDHYESDIPLYLKRDIDYTEKTYSDLINEALNVLENDDTVFTDMVNELDSWNGYADGFRCFPMDELDDLFGGCTLSDFLNKLAPDFNYQDEYMIDTIYGLSSTNDMAAVYRDNVNAGELLDNIIEYKNHLYFYDSDFENLIDEIIKMKGEE